jgi:hypothetical protein
MGNDSVPGSKTPPRVAQHAPEREAPGAVFPESPEGVAHTLAQRLEGRPPIPDLGRVPAGGLEL